MLDANTTRKPPAGIEIAGKRHLVRLPALSVRYQPLRLTGAASGLCSSIQSERSPSLSARPVWLLARNSEMTGAAGAAAAANSASRKARKVGRPE